MNIGKVLGLGSVVFLLSLGGCGQSAFDSVKVLAENGDPRSQLEIGRFYAEGLGVSEDTAEAAKWYRMAAEQGETDAQIWLRMAYETGSGVPENKVEAYAWFDVASAGVKNAELRRDGVKATLSSSELPLAESLATEYAEKFGSGK